MPIFRPLANRINSTGDPEALLALKALQLALATRSRLPAPSPPYSATSAIEELLVAALISALEKTLRRGPLPVFNNDLRPSRRNLRERITVAVSEL